MEQTSSNVIVCVRFRPLLENEDLKYTKDGTWKANQDGAWQLEFKTKGEGSVKVGLGKRIPENTFNFDVVFPPGSPQPEVYEKSARPVVEDVLKGYNGTIFAYGQTGSGKSYTMFGKDREDNNTKGVIPRAASAIFSHIHSDSTDVEYTLQVSFLEIYRENIHDLLNPGTSENLNIREHPIKGIYVENLTEEYVTCEKDIYDLLSIGEQSRAVASTRMNSVSSRSHSVFTINVSQKDKDGSVKTGKLNLVDLAGSEKVGKTGAEGQTLEEAKKINQSLSALGNCIAALVDTSRSHVPYRDSKLTRILQESLGGNTKTTLMVCASPHEYNAEETVSTLRFGQRAKSIKTTVRINKVLSPEQLMAIIEELRGELAKLKKHCQFLERELRRARGEPDIPGEDGDDYNPFNDARARVELENLKRQSEEEIEAFKFQIEEMKEKEAERDELLRVLQEKAKAHDVLLRKYRGRDSVAEAEAEAAARANALELHQKRLELIQVKTELDEMVRRDEASMQVLEELQVEIDTATRDKEEAVRQHEVLQVEFNALKQDNEKNKGRVAALETSERDLTAKLETASASLAAATADIEKLRSQNTALETRITELTTRGAELDTKIEKLNGEIATLNTSISTTVAERDQVREEKAQAQVEAEKTLATAQTTMQQQIDKEREEHAQTNTKLSDTVATLSKTQANLEEKTNLLDSLTKRHEELQATLDKSKAEAESLKQEVSALKTSVSDKESEISQKSAELSDIKSNLEAVTRERDDAHQAKLATAKEGELAQMQLQANLQKQVDTARAEVQRLNTKAAETEAELKRSRSEHEATSANLAELTRKHATTTTELADAQSKINTLESDIEGLKSKLSAARADITQRDSALVEVNSSADKLKRERDAAREEKATLLRESEQARTDLEKAHEERLNHMRADLLSQTNLLKERDEDIKKLQLEASESANKLKTANAKISAAELEQDRLQRLADQNARDAEAAKLATTLVEKAKEADLAAAEELRAATVKTLNAQLDTLQKQLADAANEAQKFKQLSESLKSQILVEKARATAQEKLAVDTQGQIGEVEGKLLAAVSQLGVKTRELEDLRTESALQLRHAEEDKAALRETIRKQEVMLANYRSASSIRKPLVRGQEESQLLAAYRSRLNHEGLKDDLNEIDSPAKREIMQLRMAAGGAAAAAAAAAGSHDGHDGAEPQE